MARNLKTATAADGDDEKLRRKIARIEAMTNVERLTGELLACVALTVKQLILLSVYIRRLEALGADVLSLHVPNMGYFRRIAHGQLLPEVFIDLVGAPALLRKVSLLSLADQRKLSSGTPLKVLIPGGSHLLIAPKDMTQAQVRQVFANGSIRTKAQQEAWLADQQQQEALKQPSSPDVIVDRQRGGIIVGELFISSNDLAGYLAQLAN